MGELLCGQSKSPRGVRPKARRATRVQVPLGSFNASRSREPGVRRRTLPGGDFARRPLRNEGRRRAQREIWAQALTGYCSQRRSRIGKTHRRRVTGAFCVPPREMGRHAVRNCDEAGASNTRPMNWPSMASTNVTDCVKFRTNLGRSTAAGWLPVLASKSGECFKSRGSGVCAK